MNQRNLGNYLRAHRRRSGLSQEEVASIIGWTSGASLGPYEWGKYRPSLRTALAFEALFRVPLAELFPEIHSATREETELEIAKLERQLQQMNVGGHAAVVIAKKLVWLTRRKSLGGTE